jgi:hypothetical protein
MTSMFTAITVTRLMIVIWLKKTKPKTVPIWMRLQTTLSWWNNIYRPFIYLNRFF